ADLDDRRKFDVVGATRKRKAVGDRRPGHDQLGVGTPRTEEVGECEGAPQMPEPVRVVAVEHQAGCAQDTPPPHVLISAVSVCIDPRRLRTIRSVGFQTPTSASLAPTATSAAQRGLMLPTEGWLVKREPCGHCAISVTGGGVAASAYLSPRAAPLPQRPLP